MSFLKKYQTVREVVKAGVEKFGRLDVICANAGTYSPMPVQFVDPMQSAYFGDDEDFEPDEL